MAADDRVVHLDAGVDEPVGIGAALDVARAQRGIEQRRVLGRVDLDVGAAQPHQLLDLAPVEVDHVGQVRVARRVGARRLLGIVVGGRLLGAEQGDLRRVASPRPQVRPFLGAERAFPAQLVDHHGPLQPDLVARFVAERDSPTAQLVETLQGVDQVAVEGIAAQLAVGDHVDPDLLLERQGLVDRTILDALEGGWVQLAGLGSGSRPLQRLRPEEAADDLGADALRAHRCSG